MKKTWNKYIGVSKKNVIEWNTSHNTGEGGLDGGWIIFVSTIGASYRVFWS
jgi:hypothetical protein